MWLLEGKDAPDHATIARFQNERLSSAMEDLFYQFVKKLKEKEEISGKYLFIDGTKIEANANRYTFVWRKAIEKKKGKLEKRTDKTLREIATRYGYREDASIEQIKEALERQTMLEGINFVSGRGSRKTQLQRDMETLTGYTEKEKEYMYYLTKMGKRNSLSKTDTDATFMRMKEDHMKNGQLKPEYNIQIGVDNEYIVGVESYNERNDMKTFIPFMKRIENGTGQRYTDIVADAGYDSEENYRYLKEHAMNAYIKPNNYEISKTKRYKEDKYRYENLIYAKDRDEYICPQNETLKFVSEYKSANGNVKRNYRCNGCSGCPQRDKCYKGRNGNREISVSLRLMEYRQEAVEMITGEYGAKLRMNRSIQVEGAFGVIKEDYSFRRLLVRGKRKTETQFFLLAFAFNIRKFHNKRISNRLHTGLFALKTA